MSAMSDAGAMEKEVDLDLDLDVSEATGQCRTYQKRAKNDSP